MNPYSGVLLLSMLLGGVVNADTLIWNDKWSGQDKNRHFVAGLIASSIVTVYTQDAAYGGLTGCTVGLLKELHDKTSNIKGKASAQDIIITCAGAYVGATLIQGLYLTPNGIIYKINF